MGLTFTSAGIMVTLFHSQSQNKLQINSSTVYLSGTITSEPLTTNKSVKFILKPVFDSLLPLPHSGKIMTFLPKDSASQKLKMGESVSLYGNISNPEPPLNPEEFDYSFYLKTQGVEKLLFVKQDNWQPVIHNSRGKVREVFSRWRKYLLETLQKNGLNGEEYDIAAAILLGNDQLIDPDTEQNFVAAGAVHILCVSGMHVGIIFLVLNFLFGFINKFKHGTWIKNLLIFILLWAYALLTGLSPSVLRATVMISFFILANALKKDYDRYNLLAASAFLLLVINPFLLFHVGFQLSYSAVLGILIFYQPLYRSLYIKNKIIDAFWAAIVVSFAAQLGAFPIAAHYFHVFPVYFLLTNLVVFLLSYLILGIGFSLLLISWLPFLPKLLGTILAFIIKILNSWVLFIARLPYSQINDIYFPWEKVIIIYLLIYFSYSFIVLKKWNSILPLLMTLILIFTFDIYRNYHLSKQKHLMVYAVNQHPVIGLVKGKTEVLLTDSVIISEPSLLNYNLNNYRIKQGLQNKILDIKKLKNSGLIRFNNQNYYILNPNIKHYPALNDKISLFAVIYWGNKYISLKKMAQSFHFKTVILTKPMPIWVRTRIAKEAKSLNIRVIETHKTGAVEISKKNKIFSKNSLEN